MIMIIEDHWLDVRHTNPYRGTGPYLGITMELATGEPGRWEVRHLSLDDLTADALGRKLFALGPHQTYNPTRIFSSRRLT